jgi:hypothetical protein
MIDLLLAFGPIATLVLFAAVVLLYRHTYRFIHRPPNQVIAYLRAVDPQELAHLFDPMAERYLHLNLGREQFRKEQRSRLWLALEYLGRIHHNARVMAEWSSYELRRTRRTRSDEDREASLELLGACVQVRLCSIVLRGWVRFWLLRMVLFPFLNPPSMEKLVNFGSTDLLKFYQGMTSAAVQLSHSYGDGYYEQMTQALRPLTLS